MALREKLMIQWNVWDEVKAPGSGGLEQAYDFTDMLGFVAWLNLLVRNHDDLGLACLAQTVNVVSPPHAAKETYGSSQISPVMTTPNGILKQVIYYP
jgi:alpha-N-arabinofuranosidase